LKAICSCKNWKFKSGSGFYSKFRLRQKSQGPAGVPSVITSGLLNSDISAGNKTRQWLLIAPSYVWKEAWVNF